MDHQYQSGKLNLLPMAKNSYSPLTAEEKQLVDILLPHMTNRETRKTPLNWALDPHYTSILKQIDWSGNAYNFTVRLIRLILASDDGISGLPAIVRLLRKIQQHKAKDDEYDLFDQMIKLYEVPYRQKAMQIVDLRPGVGLYENGLPDIVWSEEIPAGDYTIGHEDVWDNLPRKVHIPCPYHLSIYPITNRQFDAFANAPDRGDERWWSGMPEIQSACYHEWRIRELFQPEFPEANHPRDSVSWYQAIAFCRWLTYHYQQSGLCHRNEVIDLPHEYEWEVAARGTDGRLYAYAGDFDPNKGNTDDTGINRTSPVGQFPTGAASCGAMDMAGNVWEWCSNCYCDPNKIIIDINECCRVQRGGSWRNSQFSAYAARHEEHPAVASDNSGFRVVYRT